MLTSLSPSERLRRHPAAMRLGRYFGVLGAILILGAWIIRTLAVEQTVRAEGELREVIRDRQTLQEFDDLARRQRTLEEMIRDLPARQPPTIGSAAAALSDTEIVRERTV